MCAVVSQVNEKEKGGDLHFLTPPATEAVLKAVSEAISEAMSVAVLEAVSAALSQPALKTTPLYSLFC